MPGGIIGRQAGVKKFVQCIQHDLQSRSQIAHADMQFIRLQVAHLSFRHFLLPGNKQIIGCQRCTIGDHFPDGLDIPCFFIKRIIRIVPIRSSFGVSDI